MPACDLPASSRAPLPAAPNASPLDGLGNSVAGVELIWMLRLLPTVPVMHCRQMYCGDVIVVDVVVFAACGRKSTGTPSGGRNEAPRMVQNECGGD